MKCNTFKSLNSLSKIKERVYLIGASGIGMTALAKILVNIGFKVAGSDKQKLNIKYLNPLIKQGFIFYDSQDTDENIKNFNPSIAVYTKIIPKTNPEYLYCLKNSIFLISRVDFLNMLLEGYIQIAILGTHGKTTVTSLIGQIFLDAKKDPFLIIGGILPSINSNVHMGAKRFAIFEACEAFGGLESYKNVHWAIINNIDLDHLDYYVNIENLINQFKHFIYNNFLYKFNRRLFLNYDDLNIKKLLKLIYKEGFIRFLNLNLYSRFYTYDFIYKDLTEGLDFTHPSLSIMTIENLSFRNTHSTFKALLNNKSLGMYKTSLIGSVNVYNTLAAIFVAHYARVQKKMIQKSLENFKNSKRRFEQIFIKTINPSQSLKVYLDYAHHPTAIKALFEMFEQRNLNTPFSFDNCVFIFEPLQSFRTLYFLKDFIEIFKDKKNIIVYPTHFNPDLTNLKESQSILSQYENLKTLDSSEIFYNEFKKRYEDHSFIFYAKNKEELFNILIQEYLSKFLNQFYKDLYLVFIGGGKVELLAYEFIKKIEIFINKYN